MIDQNSERDRRANYARDDDDAENYTLGGARGYYGERGSYGGRFNRSGTESGMRRRMYGAAYEETDGETRGKYRRRRGFRARLRDVDKRSLLNKGLMLLGGTAVGVGVGVGIGVGVGLAAMYLFDPSQGRNRRDAARGKIKDARHKAKGFITEKANDLRDRAERFRTNAPRSSTRIAESGGLTTSGGTITSGERAMTMTGQAGR